MIDPVANLRQYVGRVYHLHGKDASIHWDAIARAGILGAVNFVDSRFPGFGDTDWRKIFAILQENGYDGAISVEGYHDPYYSHDWEMTGQLHAMRYLKWCRGGDSRPIRGKKSIAKQRAGRFHPLRKRPARLLCWTKSPQLSIALRGAARIMVAEGFHFKA